MGRIDGHAAAAAQVRGRARERRGRLLRSRRRVMWVSVPGRGCRTAQPLLHRRRTAYASARTNRLQAAFVRAGARAALAAATHRGEDENEKAQASRKFLGCLGLPLPERFQRTCVHWFFSDAGRITPAALAGGQIPVSGALALRPRLRWTRTPRPRRRAPGAQRRSARTPSLRTSSECPRRTAIRGGRDRTPRRRVDAGSDLLGFDGKNGSRREGVGLAQPGQGHQPRPVWA